MAYPYNAPAESMSSIWNSGAYTPEEMVRYIIDDFTPINKNSMRNSVGYQLSLVQNYVNRHYLGRKDLPVNTGYISELVSPSISGYNIYSDDGLTIYNTDTSSLRPLALVSDGYTLVSGRYETKIIADEGKKFIEMDTFGLDIMNLGTGGEYVRISGFGNVIIRSKDQMDIINSNEVLNVHANGGDLDLYGYQDVNIVSETDDIFLRAKDQIRLDSSGHIYLQTFEGTNSSINLISDASINFDSSGSINMIASGTTYDVINLLGKNETNVRSHGDVNIDANYGFTSYGTNGAINLTASKDINLDSTNVDIKTVAGMGTLSMFGGNIVNLSGSTMNIHASNYINFYTDDPGDDINVLSKGNLNLWCNTGGNGSLSIKNLTNNPSNGYVEMISDFSYTNITGTGVYITSSAKDIAINAYDNVRISGAGNIFLDSIPTSNPGGSAGKIWRSGDILVVT